MVLSQSETVLSVIGTNIENSYFLFLLSESLNPLSSFSVPSLLIFSSFAPSFLFHPSWSPYPLFLFPPSPTFYWPSLLLFLSSSHLFPLLCSALSLSPSASPPLRFGHQDSVSSIDCLSRERPVTAGMNDRTVRVWKIIEESQLVFHGHKWVVHMTVTCWKQSRVLSVSGEPFG